MSSRVFTDPLKKVNENYIYLDNVVRKMQDSVSNNIKAEKEKAIKFISKIDASLEPTCY